MGAAADNRYSRKMVEPRSKKANYVRQHAPAFCHTWFICKGRLICTRWGAKMSHLKHGNEENGLTNWNPRLTGSTSGWYMPHRRADSEESFDGFDRASTFSLSQLSGFSWSSSAATDSTLAPFSPSSHSLTLPPRPEEKQQRSPSTSTLEEAIIEDALYGQLDQALVEAEIAKREAFQEPIKRSKAAKNAVDALHKAKAVENLYYEELRRRSEIEEELAKAKEELESTKRHETWPLKNYGPPWIRSYYLKEESRNPTSWGRS